MFDVPSLVGDVPVELGTTSCCAHQTIRPSRPSTLRCNNSCWSRLFLAYRNRPNLPKLAEVRFSEVSVWTSINLQDSLMSMGLQVQRLLHLLRCCVVASVVLGFHSPHWSAVCTCPLERTVSFLNVSQVHCGHS